MLVSAAAVERTAAARLIAERNCCRFIPLLCGALRKETKLYTKIALSEAIASFGSDALPFIVPLLGEIGGNQHREPSCADLGKKSFPLPRDIAARIIIRIGDSAIPALEGVLTNGTRGQKLEAVEAVGHIASTTGSCGSETILFSLLRDDDRLMRWKVIRAFQSFGSSEVRCFLKKVSESDDPVLSREARRSLERIGKFLLD